MRERARHINGQLEVWSESGVGTEARVAELADPNDYSAEPDDETTADWAAESPRTSPLAHARGFDLIDDIGAVNPICRQIDALCKQDGEAWYGRVRRWQKRRAGKADWFSFESA